MTLRGGRCVRTVFVTAGDASVEDFAARSETDSNLYQAARRATPRATRRRILTNRQGTQPRRSKYEARRDKSTTRAAVVVTRDYFNSLLARYAATEPREP